MVPVDQEDQSQEEDNDIPLLEGFHWDQLMDSAALTGPQKRSLSESSLAPSSDNSAFPSLTSADAPQKRPLLADGKQQGSSVCGIKDVQREPELVEAVEEKQIGKGVAAEAEVQWRDSLVVDSDSVSEQPDGQGTGKRRRTVTVSDGNLPPYKNTQLFSVSGSQLVKSQHLNLFVFTMKSQVKFVSQKNPQPYKYIMLNCVSC